MDDEPAVAALEHIQVIEARIAKQTALIVELRQTGQDTLEAARRLVLLHHALEEMRILMGDLLPTEVKDRLRAAN